MIHYGGLSSHNVKKHKIKPQETFIKHNLDGETPTFLGIKKGFGKMISKII